MIIKQAGYSIQADNMEQVQDWIQHELEVLLDKIQVLDDSGKELRFKVTLGQK